jgi:hypothetical protein
VVGVLRPTSQAAWLSNPPVGARVGDQTGQESRSAGRRAAARVTAMNINQVDVTHGFRR